MANAKLVPDPEAIVAAFEAEFAALQARVAQPAPEVELQPAISHNGHGPAAAGHCQALTKAGQPCKNAALPGYRRGGNLCRGWMSYRLRQQREPAGRLDGDCGFFLCFGSWRARTSANSRDRR